MGEARWKGMGTLVFSLPIAMLNGSTLLSFYMGTVSQQDTGNKRCPLYDQGWENSVFWDFYTVIKRETVAVFRLDLGSNFF